MISFWCIAAPFWGMQTQLINGLIDHQNKHKHIPVKYTHTHTGTEQSPDCQFLVCQCKSALQLAFMFQPVWLYSNGEPFSNHLQAHSHCDWAHTHTHTTSRFELWSQQLLTAGFRPGSVWLHRLGEQEGFLMLDLPDIRQKCQLVTLSFHLL